MTKKASTRSSSKRVVNDKTDEPTVLRLPKVGKLKRVDIRKAVQAVRAGKKALVEH